MKGAECVVSTEVRLIIHSFTVNINSDARSNDIFKTPSRQGQSGEGERLRVRSRKRSAHHGVGTQEKCADAFFIFGYCNFPGWRT